MRRLSTWIAVLCLWLGLAGVATAAGLQPMNARAHLSPLGPVAPNVRQVLVGIYPTTVYDLNVGSSTYYLSAYVWLRWRGDIDPTKTLEFTNGVAGVSKTNLLDKPRDLPDGSKYMIMRVDGRFFQPFNMADFPLDRQRLSVRIEDSDNGVDALVYLPDRKDSGFGALLDIPGWQVKGWQFKQTMQDYGSRFGDLSAAGASDYAGLQFDLMIERSASYFVWKLFLPLAIVMGANWLVLLLLPSLVEVRTALPTTALLTLVFLQKSYTDILPTVGYLVMMDKIYAVAYLLVVATLLQVILTTAWRRGAGFEEGHGHDRIKFFDRISLGVQLLIFGVTVVVLTTSVVR